MVIRLFIINKNIKMKLFKTYVLAAFSLMLFVPSVTNAYGAGGGFFVPTAVPKVIAPIEKTAITPVSGKVLGAESFVFSTRISKGAKGDVVIELQKVLNSKKIDTLAVDGIFGPKTKAAIIKFQLANGLVGDGIVGAKTRELLNK